MRSEYHDQCSSSPLGFRCTECGFELWRPLWRFETSVLGLYDDARFPGRCLLVLDDHKVNFDDLPQRRAQAFAVDIQRAARAIRRALSPDRVNIALLGNTEPHIHAHLIPRYADDPIPLRPPWEHPEPKTKLSGAVLSDVVERLKNWLESNAGERARA